MKKSDQSGSQGTWTVLRVDDNGNEFVVSANLAEEDARELVRDFEDRGHKQAYWARRE